MYLRRSTRLRILAAVLTATLLSGHCATDVRNALRSGAMSFLSSSTSAALKTVLPVEEWVQQITGRGGG
jgi:hypothetical protein